MTRLISLLIIFVFLSCEKKEEEFSFLPTLKNKPLLVSEIGESLDIIEIQTKYPISGTPTILKSDRYFYLFEEGIVTSLHQVGLDGKVRKSIDFGNDDKLNALSITQIVTKQNHIGVITHGDQITWFDEELKELQTEKLPLKAKVHFRQGSQTISHTNGIDNDDWNIVTYGSNSRKAYLPIDKTRYGFYNQTYSPFSVWAEKVLFSQAFNDTVYVWDQLSFKPLFRVDFGSNKVTEDRFSKIQGPMDMLAFFNERKYSYLQGEVYGLDKNRILFQINEKGKQKLGMMDFKSNELTVYPGIVDNSISNIILYFPQFSLDGELYFGISGEEIQENYDRIPDSFKHRLSTDFAESYFIYRLKIKPK